MLKVFPFEGLQYNESTVVACKEEDMSTKSRKGPLPDKEHEVKENLNQL